MQTITQKADDVSFQLVPDEVVITLKHPEKANIYKNISAPVDWVAGKYIFNKGWELNPAFKEEEL